MTANAMTKAFYILAMLILAFAGSAFTQQSGGSAYSRLGIGQLEFSQSNTADGMGGAGLAVMSPSIINQVNPAMWSQINLVRFSLGLQFENTGVSDGSASARYGHSIFTGGMLAIPISASSGTILAMGVTPYSIVQYNIATPTAVDSVQSTLTYSGEGGINEAQIGLSTNITDDLHAGARFSYFIGNIDEYIEQDFVSTLYSNSSIDRQLELHGIGATYGLSYTGLAHLFGMAEGSQANISGYVSTASFLRLDETHYTNTTSNGNTVYDTASIPESRVKIPLRFGIGVDYGTNRWIAAGDAIMQNWSNVGFPGALEPANGNLLKLSGGVVILPHHETGTTTLQKWEWRFGGSYYKTYYEPSASSTSGGPQVNQYSLTTGASIPLSGDTRLGMDIEYGFRLPDTIDKENFLRLSFSLSGGEVWFTKPPTE
jgi:hypothetical protein